MSQCLEDAEALVDLLFTNMRDSPNAESSTTMLSNTFRQYIAVRKSHVEKVLDAGNRAGDSSRDMGFVGEMTMYGFMWAMCRFLFPKMPSSHVLIVAAVKFFGAFFLKTVMSYDLHAEIERAKR